MTWRKTANEKSRGPERSVGLSSGSGAWPISPDSDASSPAGGSSGDRGLESSAAGLSPDRQGIDAESDESMQVAADWSASELGVTTDWQAYPADDVPHPDVNPRVSKSAIDSPAAVNSATAEESDDRCRLGTGLVAQVSVSLDGSTPLDPVDVFGGGPNTGVTPSDPKPALEDTQRFEVNQGQGDEALDQRSDTLPEESGGLEESSRSAEPRGWWKRWRTLPLAERLAGSLISSAEAGGKIVDHAVGLAFGLQASLTSETQKLLHQRLSIATLLLFFGFFASLIAESFFFSGLNSTAEFLRFWSEVILTTVMGLVSWRLIANCPHVFRNLRLVELLVFGSAAWILALNSWVALEQGAASKHAVSLSGPWLALIFTYALFIPNHWRRACGIIAGMALAPVAITILSSVYSPTVARLAVESLDFTHGVVTLCLMSGFAAIAATWGVYTIGSLRSEVYSAKQFGQYRLSRLLGTGGMGEVYVGEHLLLKRPCAIKVIKPQRASDPKMLERFEREVRSTARLTHWNTVAIYDYGRAEDGTFFYVMEYLPGLNLSQIVKQFGPLPSGRAVHLLVQICDALAEAHHHGMVHRDLKPANIFASKRGNKYDVAKLLDFGVVRRSVSRDGQTEVSGAAVGSPLFMSPEQATGQPMDHRSDIYSLGVTAFYLLTGRPPFTNKEPMKVLRAHVRETPPTFESLGVDVPADLEQVIRRCMEKAPEGRYHDVESLRQALLSCQCLNGWTWHHSAQWWKLHRCSEKASLDLAVENDRLNEWLQETAEQENSPTLESRI